MCIHNTNDCGCNQTPCTPSPCPCPVLLSSDCVNNVTEDLLCSGILKGQTLSATLVQLDNYICEKFNTATSFFSLINIGTGSKIYKGISSIGKKEIRTILGDGLVLVTENANDISMTLDEVALDTFVTDRLPIYDGSETKLTASTNVTITGTGTIASPYVISSAIGSIADGSETKVNQGSNITITGIGTTLDPYIVNGLLPPFEKVDEGNGPGYVVRGRDATFYGNIGLDAIDFSYSDVISSTFGATGESSFAQGIQIIASGYGAVGFGSNLNITGIQDFVTGINNTTAGFTNFVTGVGHDITSMGTTVIGQASNIYSQQIADYNATDTKPLFIIGNGTIADATDAPTYQPYDVMSRSDAFIVRMNGVATLPSVTNALITAEPTGKAVVTKEYLNLQKFITYPADFTGTNYTITDADMGYSIIIFNGATAVTITVPVGLQSKMQVGFIQDGTADVTITPSSTTLKNAISGYKIKGQYDQIYIEQGSTNIVYYLLGNTKI